jgi:hypothetical protein
LRALAEQISSISYPREIAETVLWNVGDDVKAVALEQLLIFSGVQTRVIKTFPFKLPGGFAVSGPACEHQRGAWRGVSPKDGEPSPPIIMI